MAGEYNEAHRRYCRDNYSNEEAGTQISVFQRTQFNPDYDYVKSGNQITDRLCLCYVNFAKIIGEPLEGAGSKLVHFLRVVKFQKLLATTAEEILRRQQMMSEETDFSQCNQQKIDLQTEVSAYLGMTMN